MVVPSESGSAEIHGIGGCFTRREMRMRKAIWLVPFLGLFLLPAQEKQTVQKVPVSPTNIASGKEMFNHYCAACHGPSGKGDGPAASTFKKAPRDLTKLARDNGGKYPADHVAATLSIEE